MNLYAYCGNDPINYANPSGHSPEWWQWVLFGVGAALVAVAAGMAILGTGGIAAFGLGAVVGGAIGGAAAYSVTGLPNASFWTGLGPSGEIIAGQAANSQGLITLGQTFGGKVAQFMTNRFGYAATKYIWASLSKTMASTVAMNSVTLFYGGSISATSIYIMYEYPELIKRGIEIIQQLIGG